MGESNCEVRMVSIRIRLNYRYGEWSAGDVVDLPSHIANALTKSSSPNGEPFAEQIEVDPSGSYQPEGEPDVDGPESTHRHVLAPAPRWGEMTVEDLKGELRARDLKVSGTKDELIARLRGD